MSLEFREFKITDHPEALRLWESTEGIGLSDADSLANVSAFLARNPGLCFVATEGANLVGTILCGHDGRRGLIHHLAVTSEHRRKGVGRRLVAAALNALRSTGIQKCHLLVFERNEAARAFWRKIDAEERETLVVFSLMTTNAR